MTLKRGDIVLARFPHAAGGRGKKRPVLVVQDDVYNAALRHMIVAEITSNIGLASDRANFLIDISTPEGQATGLSQNSVITCLHLATMSQERMDRAIGTLSPASLQKVNDCLKAALGVT